MKYNTLQNTDLKLSAITFGAWAIGGWMWGGADKDDALDALAAAFDVGITTIDTAPVYGFGQSEEIVGKAIKNKQRDKIQILTKFGLKWDNEGKGEFSFDTLANDGKPLKVFKYARKESVIKECETSLKLLGTDHIDLLQIHWADPTTPISDTMEAMDILKTQGKIRYAGVCNYDARQVEEALKYFPIVTDQVPYSMVRREIENELIPFCLQNKVGILPYSPLQRGILTGKMKPNHVFGEGDTRPNSLYYKEPNFSRTLAFVDTLKPIAEKYNANVGQVVINWTSQQPGVVSTLVGARNREQVMDNVKALDFTLSVEDITLINNNLQKLKFEK